ncbi:hypothetical protein [Blastomonas sp.]|uniref:hypothetical protein n=1 Tax=Blastomonas sp. TaxID=1909299 RepID=UPI002617FFB7|nr:hypothetical protein [Blastomonas sp.]MDM7956387.1 hypothetical protein [Blastomonas sp.]
MRLFQEEASISRIYYESMRDNFDGYAWNLEPGMDPAERQAKREELDRLKRDFDELDPLENKKATLGQLFQIELALIQLIPFAALQARYWTIEDRFRRVLPTSVVASFDRSFAPANVDTLAPDVLRQRARILLDTIHANYLCNLERESSIKRLMFILFFAAATILAGAWLIVGNTEDLAREGLTAIILAGMVGAMISITRRLQKATARDAMNEDGIFELIGLRIGWLSVLMSIAIGGVFALFLYILVVADMIDLALPDAIDDDEREPAQDPLPIDDRTAQGSDAEGPPVAGGAEGPALGEDAGSGDGPVAPPAAPPQRPETMAAPLSCQSAAQSCTLWADRVAIALGLAGRVNFYKMIATAFIAGFGEMFVPDIINKLARQHSDRLMAPTSPPRSAE